MSLLKNPKIILAVVFIGLVIAIYVMGGSIKSLKEERTRLSANQEALLGENSRELVLTKKELKNALESNTELGLKYDSVCRALKVKPRTVTEVTILKVPYRDTVWVQAVSGTVTLNGDIYSIPVSYSNECWGMKGIIFSKDPLSTQTITEKSSDNEIDLIRGKKGILWWKKEFFKGKSKCGEFSFTHIIVKK